MFFANFFGFLVILVVVVCSGELRAACAYFAHRGPTAIPLVLLRTLLFWRAVHAYSSIIKDSGGVAAVTVGIARKVVTVLLSMFMFRKPYSNNYPFGGLFLAAALVFELRIGVKKAAAKAALAKSNGDATRSSCKQSPPSSLEPALQCDSEQSDAKPVSPSSSCSSSSRANVV